jgi:ADP-ribose pyrophosphatase
VEDIKKRRWFKMTEPKILYPGKYLNLVERDGWEYVTRNTHDVAIILPVFKNDDILLIDEFRHPLQKRLIGLPAGLVGDKDANEDIFGGARRELLEETGYQANSMELILENSPSSSGMTDETFNLLIARNLVKIHNGGGDETEDIKVLRIRKNRICAEAKEWLKNGYLIDPKIFMALFFLEENPENRYGLNIRKNRIGGE